MSGQRQAQHACSSLPPLRCCHLLLLCCSHACCAALDVEREHCAHLHVVSDAEHQHLGASGHQRKRHLTLLQQA